MPKNWDNAHLTNIDTYAADILRLYNAAARKIVIASMSANVDADTLFTFADFPRINKIVNKILADLVEKAVDVINAGTESAWLMSAEKNDELVKAILPGVDLEAKALERIMSRNLDGLEAFQNRKSLGLNLSKRIWKTMPVFKADLEMTLDVGIASGDSAAEVARKARVNLLEPDKMFRRVRDKNGVLQLSSNAKAYHPGQGVYRSSVKNAQRLTRTEINIAYREADHQRWGDMDFVVGYEVQRSNRVYFCVRCESLKGKYPKTFKFNGWHPQCRCRCIPILATDDEVDAMISKILADKDPGFTSVNEIKAVPKNYSTFIKENKPMLLRAKSVPYFIRDNYKDGKLSKGLAI